MVADSKMVKEIMGSLGADLCGIAGIDRFADAPKGFHPFETVLPLPRGVYEPLNRAIIVHIKKGTK